jgi:hypothetical protein
MKRKVTLEGQEDRYVIKRCTYYRGHRLTYSHVSYLQAGGRLDPSEKIATINAHAKPS